MYLGLEISFYPMLFLSQIKQVKAVKELKLFLLITLRTNIYCYDSMEYWKNWLHKFIFDTSFFLSLFGQSPVPTLHLHLHLHVWDTPTHHSLQLHLHVGDGRSLPLHLYFLGTAGGRRSP